VRGLMSRLASAVALGGAAVAFAMPVTSLADPPPNCETGQYWDGYRNACQPLGQGPAKNCPGGQYWDPNGDVCRELGHTAAG
jgi:hypothetical protein